MQYLILAATTAFASPLGKRQDNPMTTIDYKNPGAQCVPGFIPMAVTLVEEKSGLSRTAQRMYFFDNQGNCVFEWKHTYGGNKRSETRGYACVKDNYATLVNKKEDADLVNVRGESYEIRDGKKLFVTVTLPGKVVKTGEGDFLQCGLGWRH